MPNARRFTGKVAFVTGAASGIGRATAVAFAAEGAKTARLLLGSGVVRPGLGRRADEVWCASKSGSS